MNVQLEYPHWRLEFLRHLENIVDAQVRFEWVTHPYAAKTLRHLKFVSNFLFDTIGITKDSDKLIGVMFFNETELAVSLRFAALFRKVLDHNGENDSAVLSDPQWGSVVSAAEAALRVLRNEQRH